jgi:hypothetical protein
MLPAKTIGDGRKRRAAPGEPEGLAGDEDRLAAGAAKTSFTKKCISDAVGT